MVAELQSQDIACVLVTIIEARGSTPRVEQAKMVVSRNETWQTIGGGQLEFHAIDRARKMIACGDPVTETEACALGPSMNQCCGGHITLLYEHFPARQFDIHLFGAGHVARSLVSILGGLPGRVFWYDNRTDQFPSSLPANVQTMTAYQVEPAVESASTGSWFVIMTHSHSLDLQICEAVLSRSDIAYCGLIGSKSKAARFKKRLRERSFCDEELVRLCCPMGHPDIDGKLPMEIAISISADLLKRKQLVTTREQSRLTMISAS